MFVWLVNILIVSLFAGLAIIFGDLFMKHGADDSVRASDLLIKGPLSRSFWIIVVGLGAIVPAGLIVSPLGSLIPHIVAALLALFGLWMYEYLWIKAGQAVPLS